MNRDVQIVSSLLAGIVADAALIQKHLEDLHSVAYERGASGGEQTTGTRRPVYNDEVGSSKAKMVWKRANQNLADAAQRLEKTRVAFNAILSAGPGVDESLAGTFLTHTEYQRALIHREQRQARGEYTPALNEDMNQPEFPKVGELCWHCNETPVAPSNHKLAKGMCSACGMYRKMHGGILPPQEILKARFAR